MKTDDRPTDDVESFEARLRAGLDHIASTTPVQAPGEFAPDVMPLATADEHRRRSVPILAVAAVASVVVTGLALITTRDTEPARSDQPAPAPTPEVDPTGEADSATGAATGPDIELAPGGALVFDETPAGLSSAVASALIPVGPVDLADYSDYVRRWYTADIAQPELAASLAVDAMPAVQLAPNVPPEATEPVTIQGAAGQLYDDPMMVGRSVTFTLDDTTYALTGANMTAGELLSAAEYVRPADDGYGAVVDQAGLTNGLVERSTGTSFESSFISTDALEDVSAGTRWDDGDVMVWVTPLTEDPALLPLHRLGYDTVTDTTVHGQPAFVTTLSNQPSYHGVTWSENGITYLVGTNGLDAETAVDYANRLRPATAAEWDQLVQETEAREAARAQAAPPSTAPMRTAPDTADGDATSEAPRASTPANQRP